MPISPEDDAPVALVMRVECHVGDPAPGSVHTRCDYCDADCWVAPSTLTAQANGLFEKFVCCHCSDTHDPFAMLRKMLAAPEGVHWHDFGRGQDCSCGATYAEWMELPEEARATHGMMQMIYEGLKKEQEK